MSIIIGEKLCQRLMENVADPERYVTHADSESIMLARVDENNQWSDDPVEGDTMFVTGQGIFVKDHIFELTSAGLNEAMEMLNGDAPREDYPLNEDGEDDPDDGIWEMYFKSLLGEIQEDVYGHPKMSLKPTGSCKENRVYLYAGFKWDKLEKELMILIKGNFKLGYLIAENLDGDEVVRVKCNSFERFDSSKRTFVSAIRKYLLGK